MSRIAAAPLLIVFAGVAALVVWWLASSGPVAFEATAPARPAHADPSTEIRAAAAPDAVPPERDQARDGEVPAGDVGNAPSALATAPREPDLPAVDTWPVAPVHRTSDGARSAAPAGTPAVPARIAFRALWYLGTDPDAEKTWLRAINDPSHPPGVRSDLIVDMIDEGYTDNSHPTEADLPVILARLELIERYAPYAIDEVNARAFEVAYRHLLDLYVDLGGARRGKR